MKRVVIDTNAFVSAAVKSSENEASILELVVDGATQLCISSILEERKIKDSAGNLADF